jgi:adenylate kinase
MLNVVLIGPPGSGKGTQAQKIAEHWSLLHVSTGELLRDEVKKETPLGLSVASVLAQGLLVSDDIVLGLIRDRITSLSARGFLLDGYPRNIDQARELNSLLEEIARPITHVIEFIVSDEELISRIQGRQAVSGRSDDTGEVLRERLGVYGRYSIPVLEFYHEQSLGNGKESIKFGRIDGVGSVDEVFSRIRSALD